MADYDGLTPGQVLADASVAEFIKTLGLGIAEAQQALDENSVNQIAEFIEPREGLGGKTLLDLGLSPAFYHYQHADITCSMQLSLRVEKNLSLGLNLSGSFNDTSTESGSSTTSETSSESGTSTRTETRQANIEITSASAGALTVGGQQFQLNGTDPRERIRNLQNALTGDPSAGVARVLYQLRPSQLTITTDANADEVHTTSNTVAFLGGGFDRGVIRIGNDVNTDYVLNSSHTASTTTQGSLQAYAAHVEAQITAEGYDAHLIAPGAVLHTFKPFVTGRHELLPTWHADLDMLARTIIQLGVPVEIQGFADRQTYPGGQAASDSANRDLGNNRAQEVMNYLQAQGVPTASMNRVNSEGDAAAGRTGDTVGTNNPDFRKVEVRTAARSHYLLWVRSRSGGPNLNNNVPDMIGDTGSDNGFILLYRPTPLNLSGKSVTIDGTNFPFRGTAAPPHGENSPAAYAHNLSADINNHASAGLKASAEGNVVTVSKDGDKFQLTLVTAERRQISLSGSSGVTVTEQFSRSRSSNLTQQNTGNRAVAVGASLDVRFSRQFEMNVTGNSSISARLVSIPAPPQFLESIRDFLKEE